MDKNVGSHVIFEFRSFQSHCNRCLNSGPYSHSLPLHFQQHLLKNGSFYRAHWGWVWCCNRIPPVQQDSLWNFSPPRYSTIREQGRRVLRHKVRTSCQRQLQISKPPPALTSAKKTVHRELRGMLFQSWAASLGIMYWWPSTFVHMVHLALQLFTQFFYFVLRTGRFSLLLHPSAKVYQQFLEGLRSNFMVSRGRFIRQYFYFQIPAKKHQIPSTLAVHCYLNLVFTIIQCTKWYGDNVTLYNDDV